MGCDNMGYDGLVWGWAKITWDDLGWDELSGYCLGYDEQSCERLGRAKPTVTSRAVMCFAMIGWAVTGLAVPDRAVMCWASM
jgi:hypothetical protein